MNFKSSVFKTESIKTIENLFCTALGAEKVWEAKLLEGGLFNTSYYVEYGLEKKKAVLRLGPVNRERLAGFEMNLMRAEEYVYSLCKEIGIPCSHILACDTSKELVDRDFMIVEYIPSVVMVKAELTQKKREELHFAMGRYLARFHQMRGGSFGFVSRILEGKQFATWSEALIFEVEDLTERMRNFRGLSEEEIKAVREIFYENRELLDDIKVPRLLHTDLWEGNILLDEKTLDIKAIIDSDRAVFGDPDFEFASPWQQEKPFLLEGYGRKQEAQSEAEKQRWKLYQIFYFLLEAYVGIGEYNDRELYRGRKAELLKILASGALR